MKIGVVGNGFVGQSTRLLGCDSVEVIVYDIVPDKCIPVGTTLEDIGSCDIAFVCVPTPSSKDGTCHTGFVKSVVDDLNSVKQDHCDVIIRSTVPPGTSKQLGCNHMPEFLREKSWKNDFITSKEWVIGCNDIKDLHFHDKISLLFTLAKENKSIQSDEVYFVSSETSEMLKYTKNSYLAVKVSFFNEIESLCQKLGVDFEEIRSLLVLDDRITESHTHVPGHDDKKGYGGTCLPKDILALCRVFEDNKIEPIILGSSVKRNTEVDRPEKDWEMDKNRAVL